LNVIDSHLHAFRNERIGVISQGGEKLAGFSGVLEEVRAILAGGRIGGVLALASVAVELSRRAEKMGWPEDLSPARRGELEEELESKLLQVLMRENEWICSATSDDDCIEPVIFATPTLEGEAVVADVLNKVERYRLKAIKIHPALDLVFPTHPGYRAIFELAQQKGLTIISHGGGSEGAPYASETDYCAPEGFTSVLRDFPELRLVVSHLGYPYLTPLIEMAASYPNLYTDLSFILGIEELEQTTLREAIRGFGVDRVLFGSDFPYFNPETSLDRLEALGLSADEVEKITSRNAVRLFGLACGDKRA
jgi:predicted TIM-barrel fold metal-dependent hydrolase